MGVGLRPCRVFIAVRACAFILTHSWNKLYTGSEGRLLQISERNLIYLAFLSTSRRAERFPVKPRLAAFGLLAVIIHAADEPEALLLWARAKAWLESSVQEREDSP